MNTAPKKKKKNSLNVLGLILNRKRYNLKRLIVFWILCLSLAACAGTSRTEEQNLLPVPRPPLSVPEEEPSFDGVEPGYAETRPRSSVRDELTVTFSSGNVELDFRKAYLSQEAQIFTGIYEGLFSYNPYSLEPEAAIARRWQTSDDKKTWTFTLRKNAKYQNGDSIKAEDFRAAWLSLLEPGRDAPYSSLFDIIKGAREYRLGQNNDPRQVGISVNDDETLVVELNNPAVFFPSMLCHHSFSPIHPSMLDDRAWASGKLVSNGPFYLEDYSSDRMTLRKNEYYWDSDSVALNKLTLKFAKDDEDAASLWNSGESRWIAGNVDTNALTDLSGVLVNAMFATHYYYIRSAKRPWDDYRLRRALVLALPWKELRQGYFLPAKTLIFPLPGYPEIEGLEKDNIEEARKLLEEAGFAGGAGLPSLVIRITPSEEAERIAHIMASAWINELGIETKTDVVPYRNYFQSLKQNDYDIGATTWVGDFADPYTFLQMWRRDSNLNDARYNDADYEALMEKSMTEEGDRRWRTLAEAEELLLNRGSVLPISYSPALNIVDTDELAGWYPNALDLHPFKYFSFKGFRPLPGVAMGKL
jgi:peptide/nickel transport system substrate-binding protein/oligopeptide transport system substrate-binding protein